MRVTADRWGVVSSLSGGENRPGPGVSAAPELGNTGGRPPAAPQDTRLPPSAPAPAASLPPRAAPCPAQRSQPHLPAEHQLKRLFWRKHALTVTPLFKENISRFFPGTALGSFLSGAVTTARGLVATRAVTVRHLSPRLCGLQVGHPSPSRQQNCSNSSWERCPGCRTSLTEPLGSPRVSLLPWWPPPRGPT